MYNLIDYAAFQDGSAIVAAGLRALDQKRQAERLASFREPETDSPARDETAD